MSGDSEGEQTERLDENLTDKEEPEKQVKSVSKTKRWEDAQKSLDDIDEPNGEENPDLRRIGAEGSESVPEDSKDGDEGKYHSEDKEADESNSAIEEVANEDDKSDSEGSQEANRSSRHTRQKKPRIESSNPPGAHHAEISDDEPLVFTSTLLLFSACKIHFNVSTNCEILGSYQTQMKWKHRAGKKGSRQGG